MIRHIQENKPELSLFISLIGSILFWIFFVSESILLNILSLIVLLALIIIFFYLIFLSRKNNSWKAFKYYSYQSFITLIIYPLTKIF